jgi:phosphocarrier protein
MKQDFAHVVALSTFFILQIDTRKWTNTKGVEDMQQTFTIKNPTGVHARPAGAILKKASTFACKVELEKADGTRVSAKGMVGILKLGLKQGDQVTVITEGDGEAEALQAVGEVIESIFE